MERPWFSSSSVSLFLGVGLLGSLLSSCLDLSVKVTFRTATAGQVQVDALAYRLPRASRWPRGATGFRFRPPRPNGRT